MKKEKEKIGRNRKKVTRIKENPEFKLADVVIIAASRAWGQFF